MKGLYALLLAGLLLTVPAQADEPSPDRPDLERPEPVEQFPAGLNPSMRGEFSFSGTVLGQDRQAIPDVQVKLFIGGVLAESHVTDSVGQYKFARTIDFSRDETVLLWFTDPSRRLASKAFVLDESEAARTHRLLSPCFTRLAVEPTVESTIYLFDPETRAQQIAEQKCI